MQDRKALTFVLGLVLTFSSAAFGLATESSVLKIEPERLEIGASFSGSMVNFSGFISSNRDIIIEVLGPEENSKFNIKGKVGPFWMNREKVELEHAPLFYKLLLPENQKWKDRSSPLPVGIKHIKERISMKPEHLSFDRVFDLFVQLKHAEKLYAELSGAIKYGAPKDGKKSFEASVLFPPSTVAGGYRIKATRVGDGRQAETLVRGFRVAEAGIVKAVHLLAFQRPLLYGILSVMIALFFGSFIALVFRRSGTH